MRIKLFFVVFLNIILCTNSLSQKPIWSQTNGPFGGDVQTLIRTQGNIMLAGTSLHGIFKSIDDGRTWQESNSGLNTNCVYSFVCSHNGSIYVSTYGGIYRSIDDGATWQKVFSTSSTVMSISIDNNNYIFAAAGTDRIQLSLDGGSTWKMIYPGNPPKMVIALCTAIDSSGNYFVGTESDGIFKSIDKGASWTQIQTNFQTSEVYSLAFTSAGDLYAGTNGNIYCMSRGDNHWSLLNDISFNGKIYSIVLQKDSSIFICCEKSGLFRGKLLKKVWEHMDSGLPTCSVYSYFMGSTSYVATSEGIFISSDQGKQWEESNNGLNNSNVASLAMSRKGTIFAGTFGRGIYTSTDNGNQWIPIGPKNNYIWSMSLDSSGGIYAGTWFTYGKGYSGVLATFDNGKTWEQRGLSQQGIYSLVFSENGFLFAATDEGIYRSSDKGTKWTKIKSTDLLEGARCLLSKGKNLVFAGLKSGLIFSMNSGKSWIPSSLKDIEIWSLCMRSNGDIIAGSSGNGLFISTDDGASWNQINNGLWEIERATFVSLCSDSSGDVYSASDDGMIYKLCTNSETWEVLGDRSTNLKIRALAVNKYGQLIFGTEGYGVCSISNK